MPQAEKPITDYFSVSEHGTGTKGIIFLFGGWRFPFTPYWLLMYYLRQPGFKCVIYVPRTRLIAVGTPYSEIVQAAKAGVADVARRVNEEQNRSPNAVFRTFGISFGTLFALEVAKRTPAIHKAVLIAPFGDFAEHVTLWQHHRFFSKVLQSQPTELAASAEVLNQVGPLRNLELLQGKELLVYYGSKDGVVHTQVSENMITALRAQNIPVTVVKFWGWHYNLMLKLKTDRRYIHFLDS